MQLHRHAEAVAYLHYRGLRSPELIEHMRIGYAPGGCLRGWLTRLGYPLPALRQAGLVSAAGYDTFMHRIVFPLEGNLYGRSLSTSAPPHRFLPGAKGGLYLWEQVRQSPEVPLAVEHCRLKLSLSFPTRGLGPATGRYLSYDLPGKPQNGLVRRVGPERSISVLAATVSQSNKAPRGCERRSGH